MFFSTCRLDSEELETIDALIKDKYEYLDTKYNPCATFGNKTKQTSDFFDAKTLSRSAVDELFIKSALKNYIQISFSENDVLKLKQLDLLSLNDFKLKCKDFSFYVDMMQAYMNIVPSNNALKIGDTAKLHSEY